MTAAQSRVLAALARKPLMTANGVAVAVDGAVFPRASWDTPVGKGWEIEILTAVQGG